MGMALPLTIGEEDPQEGLRITGDAFRTAEGHDVSSPLSIIATLRVHEGGTITLIIIISTMKNICTLSKATTE